MKNNPALRQGDKVGLIALASKIDVSLLEPSIHFIENVWGLQVVLGKSPESQYHNFAGDDATRLADFQMMLDNPDIKAIFSFRGGWGCSRIIDSVDFSTFKKSPKWIIGYSDITTIHCHLNRLGYQSVHAIMPGAFLKTGMESSIESLRKVLFNESKSYEVPTHTLNRIGKAKGVLVGGNLCILAHLIGSKSELDTKGKILFIEDVGEYHYNLDRMLVQLKRAGKLAKLAGLVVGTFSDLKDTETPFGKTAYEIVQEHTAEYGYPIAFGFPVGHEGENLAMPCGRKAQLEVSDNASILTI